MGAAESIPLIQVAATEVQCGALRIVINCLAGIAGIEYGFVDKTRTTLRILFANVQNEKDQEWVRAELQRWGDAPCLASDYTHAHHADISLIGDPNKACGVLGGVCDMGPASS